VIPRPILHELGFMATFMGWLAFALYAASWALIVAGGYAVWWVAR